MSETTTWRIVKLRSCADSSCAESWISESERRWMGEWRQTPSKPRHFGPRARWRWSIAAYDAETPF